MVHGDVLYSHDIPTGPVLLLPGMASSQLHAWNTQVCNGSFGDSLYKDIHVGDRIWIDASRVIGHKTCWSTCMKLNAHNQTDTTCKLRAAEGFASIAELDPGVVTGPLSHVWGSFISELIEDFDLGPEKLLVASYDWRLPCARLQERDSFFWKLMRKFEEAVYRHGRETGKMIVIAHSMGNNVFRYFLKWLYDEKGKHHYQKWINAHIRGYFAIAPPLLGGNEPIECILTGLPNGLPITLKESRIIQNTFGSSTGLLPFAGEETLQDSAKADQILVSIKMMDKTTKEYTLRNISDGTMFRDLASHDPIVNDHHIILEKYYSSDNNMFSPWERPSIDNVYVIYGTGTPARETFAYEQVPAPNYWKLITMHRESGDALTHNKTGDGTVPYYSLSWSHSWLGQHGDTIHMTKIPAGVYFFENATHYEQYTIDRARRHAVYETTSDEMCTSQATCDATKHIIYFESDTFSAGRPLHTSVIELPNVKHRHILGNAVFHREMTTILQHLFQNIPKVSKHHREPTEDIECYWDYLNARCYYELYCAYSYRFGDVTLDQSCRIKQMNYGQETATEKDHCRCLTKCNEKDYCRTTNACTNTQVTHFGSEENFWIPCVSS